MYLILVSVMNRDESFNPRPSDQTYDSLIRSHLSVASLNNKSNITKCSNNDDSMTLNGKGVIVPPHNQLSMAMNSHLNSSSSMANDDSDSDEPMVCEICDDKATGLHYGIITCEGLVYSYCKSSKGTTIFGDDHCVLAASIFFWGGGHKFSLCANKSNK